MQEKDIKIKVVEHLIKKEKHFIVVPEVGLGQSITNTRGQVRADIFAVNGYISIYEIKSEKDSLKRAEDQIRIYKQYANKVYMVVAEKFKDDALELDPSIGLYVINGKKIELIREADYLDISPENYLEYWWGAELKKLFRGCKDANKMRYEQGLEKLRKTLNDEQIKNLTLYRLKERYKEESDLIKQLVREKQFEQLFPKREFKKNIQVTPLKDIPFGVINPVC